MTRLVPALFLIVLTAELVQADQPSIEMIADVAYGPDEQQRLDIYFQSGVTEKRPVVLWVHGGGWSGLDKRQGSNGISTLADALVAKGFIAVSCNYRLAPKHRHPTQLQDVQRVVRWLRANAERYHIDPERIGAAGVSAGGHLAAMLAVRQTASPQGDDLDRFSSRVQAAVSLSGPTDLRDDQAELSSPVLTEAIKQLIGEGPESAARRQDASPIRFADADSSPLLFIVGADDQWVPPAHARLMAQALKAKNIDSDVVTIEGKGHELLPNNSPRAQDALTGWFEKKLKR